MDLLRFDALPPQPMCRITVASWLVGVGLWATALVLLSIP
jgi:hypothetical protein